MPVWPHPWGKTTLSSALRTLWEANGSVLPGIEPALQDQYGGYLVDDILAVAHSPPDGVQMAMRLRSAHALIPKMDGQTKFRAQSIGKLFRCLRPWTTVPGEMDRPPHHNFHTSVAPHQPAQGAQIVALAGMLQGQERLRRNAKFVGDGNTNAPRAMIEAQDSWGDARWRRRFHVSDGTRNDSRTNGTSSDNRLQ